MKWFLSKTSQINTNFFKLNRIQKREYLSKLFEYLNKRIALPEDKNLPPLTIHDIFPDIKKIEGTEMKNIDQILSKIPECVIQDELRNALREKGASPIPRRKKDSSLEVADVEHFHLNVEEATFSFAIVVKGYKSLGGSKNPKKLNWERVSYQISRAHNRTKPDYIIFVSALEPVDGVISEMHLEGNARGNPYLIIFMLPLELAKFLRWRQVI